MSKRYLLLKCSGGEKREPIDSFMADGMEEAAEALKWLKAHHPEREKYKLGPGEFFEIVDEAHCPPDEWNEALARLRGKELGQPAPERS